MSRHTPHQVVEEVQQHAHDAASAVQRRAHDAAAAVAGALQKPVLRGWLHLVCFFLALPAGVLVVALAPGPRSRVGALVYAVGLVALFGVSGAYHRGRWSEHRRRLMQRLDHGTIFVMIAGSYTPLCLLVLRGWLAWAMLAIVWTGAAAGFLLAFANARRWRIARGALYIVLGWVSIIAAPQLLDRLTPWQVALIAVGGILFTVGAIFLATHWPDPFPRVFGYHEVWHAMVVAAVACHFVAIASVVGNPSIS